ncbi:hypothetical protein [Micromonospora auratinigra]|uniref:Uncharacterized protein n=1 Tax=Micromonospora auratinigra TaxID=261654 RepID=A0A1A8ZAG5_9ACTN|nr:hypothetical protein [Micromonospora auratinigra]SBT40821.1 hypothetical protein GA0070611_1402 [Micromonospora auratinigra]
MDSNPRWTEWRRAKRLLLVEDIQGNDRCNWLVLREPVFIRAGERYRTEPDGLTIEHGDGSRTTCPGGWETRLYSWTLNGDQDVGQ